MIEFSVSDADVITPSDSADIENPGFGLWVGVSGDVKITTMAGGTFTLPAVVAGVWHPQTVQRVWSTDTTATGILVGW